MFERLPGTPFAEQPHPPTQPYVVTPTHRPLSGSVLWFTGGCRPTTLLCFRYRRPTRTSRPWPGSARPKAFTLTPTSWRNSDPGSRGKILNLKKKGEMDSLSLADERFHRAPQLCAPHMAMPGQGSHPGIGVAICPTEMWHEDIRDQQSFMIQMVCG